MADAGLGALMTSAYRYLVGDLNPSSGNGLRAEIPMSSFKYSHILNRPGGFSAGVPLRHPKATRENLDPGRTAIHIERDGVIVWSGILWTAQASIAGAELQVGGEGWWSYLRRRFIGLTKTYAAVDQFAIAQDLLNYAQGQVGGNIGVVVGSETSGQVRDRSWFHYQRKNIAEAVEELAAVQNGFDFAVDVAYESGVIVKRFRPSYPRRGRSTPIVFELGSNIEGLNVDVDATRQANVVHAIGGGVGGTTDLIATAVDLTQVPTWPLLEAVVSFKDVSVDTTLAAHAAAELAGLANPVERLPTLLAHAGPDTQIGSFVVGDSAQVKAEDGWVSFNKVMRIMSYEVSVDNNGREQVSVAFAEEAATSA